MSLSPLVLNAIKSYSDDQIDATLNMYKDDVNKSNLSPRDVESRAQLVAALRKEKERRAQPS